MSVMRPETKLLEKPIRTGKIPQEANENAKKIQGNYLWRGETSNDHVTIGFSFACDWFRGWAEF